jgi:gamma-glutamylcyclotransferase (GGCT)/AIG2-like uncharacterized protein YtfP
MSSPSEITSSKTIVGYGTFITSKKWSNYSNVEVCLIKGYRRILPPGNWFPYVLPDESSQFWGLKFEVTFGQLSQLDKFEGVDTNLYYRRTIQVVLKDKSEINADIYLPTETTVIREKLTLEMDNVDAWKFEMKKYKEIVERFPELLL